MTVPQGKEIPPVNTHPAVSRYNFGEILNTEFAPSDAKAGSPSMFMRPIATQTVPQPQLVGHVDRTKLTWGMVVQWINAFVLRPVSETPFVPVEGRKSYRQPWGHDVHRTALNGFWYLIVGGISNNTGFVAETQPGAQGGRVAEPGPNQGHYGVRMNPARPMPFALQIPRPSTLPQTRAPISILP